VLKTQICVTRPQCINNIYKKTYYSTLRQGHGARFGKRMRKASAVTTSNLFTLVIEVQRQLQFVYLLFSFGYQSHFILQIRFLQRSWTHLQLHSKSMCYSYLTCNRKESRQWYIPKRLSFGTRPSTWVLL